MRAVGLEYILSLILFTLSVILISTELNFLGYVWYDKLLHMMVGVIFMSNYVRIEHEGGIITMSVLFALLFEIIYNLVYPSVLIPVRGGSLVAIFTEFVMKLQTLDELLDIAFTAFGCVVGGRIGTRDGVMR